MPVVVRLRKAMATPWISTSRTIPFVPTMFWFPSDQDPGDAELDGVGTMCSGAERKSESWKKNDKRGGRDELTSTIALAGIVTSTRGAAAISGTSKVDDESIEGVEVPMTFLSCRGLYRYPGFCSKCAALTSSCLCFQTAFSSLLIVRHRSPTIREKSRCE